MEVSLNETHEPDGGRTRRRPVVPKKKKQSTEAALFGVGCYTLLSLKCLAAMFAARRHALP